MKYTPDSQRYVQNHFRRCGDSGLLLPLISLGLWHNFGDVDDKKNYKKIIFKAFDQGITHYDLANNYGPPPGSAENNFGKILSKEFKNYRDELIISTKAGYRMWPGPYGEWGSRKYLLSSIDQSLKRMNLDYVDIFYSHRFDPNTPLEETIEALVSIYASGKALYIGISNYGKEETQKSIELLQNAGVPLLIHQPKYSMLVRDAENGLLALLNKNKVGCIPYSPLAQGLLTSKYMKGIPKKSRIANPNGFLQEKDLTPHIIKTISALHEIALKRSQSLAQMAVAWLLQKEEISSVLVGASSTKQLLDILQARENYQFSDEELSMIERILQNE